MVDLTELFTFDKLRESGRVSIITTEEFLAKEASPGGLGVEPDKGVMRLDPKVKIEVTDKAVRLTEAGSKENVNRVTIRPCV